jgi:hypothetical protein
MEAPAILFAQHAKVKRNFQRRAIAQRDHSQKVLGSGKASF